MAAKSLVDSECGRPNALVSFARTHVQGGPSSLGASTRPSILHSGYSLADKLAREYLSERAQASAAPPTFDMRSLAGQLPAGMAAQWADDYASSSSSQKLASQWTDDFASSNAARFNDAWADTTRPTSSASSGIPNMWPSEYLDKFDEQSSLATAIGDSWASEFFEERGAQPSTKEDALFKNLETEWESLQRSPSAANLETPSQAEYHMEIDNPYLNEPNLMEKGNELLENGDLANSILYFEAAVQKNPKDAHAWLMLGLSQAENEQDLRAVAAYRKVLDIDNTNLDAMLALAVSYANESMENEALSLLERWLEVHPLYATKLPLSSPTVHFSASFLDQGRFRKVEERFLAAAQMQPSEGDAQLQNALGVLYNLNRNFDRAIDSIKAALALRPNDARLWNRLGATLANSDRTVEAVSAYRQALAIFPSYVRARYNLGISCMHLNSYNEALEHLLCALELQSVGGGGATSGGSSSASSIWPTVRSALIRRGGEGCRELLAAVDARDLRTFSSLLRAAPPHS